MSELTIALAKGRLADLSIDLLEACGVDCTAVRNPGRRLVMIDQANQTRFVLVKPSDVPVYVERGVADIGIVGKDTLMEAGSPVYEMLDLGFARCRLCIAGFPTQQAREPVGANWRVATKYPNIARSYFGAKGLPIDIIRLNGSVELGPLVGLSDVILDIVESGNTLRANGLDVLEEICPISARLIVNRVSLKTNAGRIKPLIDALRTRLEQEDEPHSDI